MYVFFFGFGSEFVHLKRLVPIPDKARLCAQVDAEGSPVPTAFRNRESVPRALARIFLELEGCEGHSVRAGVNGVHLHSIRSALEVCT